MIDTCEVVYLGPQVGKVELAHLAREVPGLSVNGSATTQRGSDEMHLSGYNFSGYCPGIGPVRQDIDGAFRMGRSLVKTRQELLGGVSARDLSNVNLMTADECNETFTVWTEATREIFPWLRDAELRVSRADVCYDRRVGDSLAVVSGLRGAVRPTRGGCAWFDNSKGQATGIIFRGKKVVHRVYDKGLESGRKRVENVLRSEEQLRRGSRGLELVTDGQTFSREGCVEVMNNRYLDVGYGEEVDVRGLICREGGGYQLALFVLHPELLDELYHHGEMSRTRYYDVRKQVNQVRAAAIPVDLRIPYDAWLKEAS